MKCHSKWNVTDNSFTQNGMSIKMKRNSKWNAAQTGMSLKMKCYSKWKVTQNGMSLKM